MSKRFIISDTHFDHKNIIEYCDRPFKDVYDMEKTLIENWNSVVRQDDIIFHLGDFAFFSKNKIREIVKRLNGKIVLIKGNHDNFSNNFYNELFYDFIPYPIIVDDFFILSHHPLSMNKHMPYVNIHGHLHNNSHRDFKTGPKHFNVCVENINYKPVDFDELKKKIDKINWGK